jgi:hypothetical protein
MSEQMSSIPTNKACFQVYKNTKKAQHTHKQSMFASIQKWLFASPKKEFVQTDKNFVKVIEHSTAWIVADYD